MKPEKAPELSTDKLSIALLPPGLSLLDGFSSVLIGGDEAEAFLQGQFTNQILDLPVGAAQLNAYCNPKGRVIAVFWLLNSGAEYRLVMPTDLVESLAKRLTLYKMRAKVTVDIEDKVALVGAVNLDATNDLTDIGFSHFSVDENRMLYTGPATGLEALPDRLATPLFVQAYWKLAQILHGEAQVYQSTSESYIPQHINLDLVNAVSFSKGCYPGQEIVARLRYLGKLKQRMIIGVAESTSPLSPGMDVFSDGSKVGSVVDAVFCGSNQICCVNIAAKLIDEGKIHLAEMAGPLLQRLPPPYRITVEKE